MKYLHFLILLFVVKVSFAQETEKKCKCPEIYYISDKAKENAKNPAKTGKPTPDEIINLFFKSGIDCEIPNEGFIVVDECGRKVFREKPTASDSIVEYFDPEGGGEYKNGVFYPKMIREKNDGQFIESN